MLAKIKNELITQFGQSIEVVLEVRVIAIHPNSLRLLSNKPGLRIAKERFIQPKFLPPSENVLSYLFLFIIYFVKLY